MTAARLAGVSAGEGFRISARNVQLPNSSIVRQRQVSSSPEWRRSRPGRIQFSWRSRRGMFSMRDPRLFQCNTTLGAVESEGLTSAVLPLNSSAWRLKKVELSPSFNGSTPPRPAMSNYSREGRAFQSECSLMNRAGSCGVRKAYVRKVPKSRDLCRQTQVVKSSVRACG